MSNKREQVAKECIEELTQAHVASRENHRLLPNAEEILAKHGAKLGLNSMQMTWLIWKVAGIRRPPVSLGDINDLYT